MSRFVVGLVLVVALGVPSPASAANTTPDLALVTVLLVVVGAWLYPRVAT